MVLDYLDPTPQYRLSQICNTLKTMHGVDIAPALADFDNLEENISKYSQERDKLIEASSFNSYAHNPDYIASMLILEALRIQLTEVAPRRRPKQSVKEAQDSTMVSKEQQRLEFARKLEQFATHTSPPSKTGKLSTDEKALQDQRDLFVVALQNIAEKLQHQGTAFARPEENKLTPLEVNIAKLMRHAEAAGILDSLDPRKMTMVVNKGVEMYGQDLLAARGEQTAPYAKTDKTIDEIKAEDPEAERAKAEFFKRGGTVTHGPSKVARGSEKHRRSMQGGHLGRTGSAAAMAPIGGLKKYYESKKPDADGDGIPDWADKHPKKKGGKEDRKMNEAQLSPKQRKMAALGGNPDKIDAADLSALRHGATIDEDDFDFDMGFDDASMGSSAHDAHQDPVMHGDIKDIAQVKGVDIHHSDAHQHDVKHYEYQASMARSELYRNAKYAMAMLHQIKPDEEIQPWIAGALTKAANYLDKIYHYLDYYKTFEPDQLPEDMDMDMELGETSGSIARQNLMMICEYSTKLFDMIQPGDHLEGWVAMKLTTASECVSSSKHYLEYVQFEQNGLDDHFDDARRANRKMMAESAIKKGKKRRRLAEQQDLEQAETLLAAKDLSDQLQQTAEKLAKMGVEDLMPLVDVMRQQFGPEAASGFNDTVKAALDSLLDSTTQTKDQVDQSIETLQGGGVPAQAGTPEVTGAGDELAGAAPGGELPAVPELGAEEPSPEEPLGRSKKEPLGRPMKDEGGLAEGKKGKIPPQFLANIKKKKGDKKPVKEGLAEAWTPEMIRFSRSRSPKDACDVLGRLRQIGKEVERHEPYEGNFASEYSDDVWSVWQWLENRVNTRDATLQEIMKPIFHLREEAKTLLLKPGSGANRAFANHVVNALYPLIVWIDENAKSIEQNSPTTPVKESNYKCLECVTGMYEEDHMGRHVCNECGATMVMEKWGTKMKTAKKDIGKWDGWTIAELKAKKKKLMDKEERSAAEQKEVKQIDFALRAKGTKGKKWGKVAEDLAPGQTDPYSNMSDSKLQQLANGGDATAKTLWAQRQSGVTQTTQESAPPGEKAERFIRQNKAKFRKQYGDRGDEVLYATAWKQFGKKSESQQNAEMQLESVQAMIKSLNDQLDVYRADFRLQLAEGKTVDPLNVGYGLDGEIVAGKIKTCEKTQRRLQQIIEAEKSKGIKKIQEQVAAVVEIRNLQSQMNTKPYGVVYVDHAGKKQQKFFESAANLKLWQDLNSKDIKVIRSVTPQDFQAKISRLKKI